MARIIQTIAAPGVATSSGLTEAQVTALIKQYSGYEYITTVKLTTTEVSGIEITGLDSSIYSGFKIVTSRLGYGGSTVQVTWTVRILTGANTVDSSTNYEYQGIKFSNNQGIYASGQTGWSTTFGYAGPAAVADFWLDYNISPGSSLDANMWLQVTDSKPGGYWPSSGIMTGIHSNNGAVPTGIRIDSNQNFRAIQDNAYINVLGLRIKV